VSVETKHHGQPRQSHIQTSLKRQQLPSNRYGGLGVALYLYFNFGKSVPIKPMEAMIDNETFDARVRVDLRDLPQTARIIQSGKSLEGWTDR